MIDHILPEQMTSDMRETIWNTITSHSGDNLEYWIEALYNDIRFAAIPFGSGAAEARKDAELYGIGFTIDGVRVEPSRVKIFKGENP